MSTDDYWEKADDPIYYTTSGRSGYGSSNVNFDMATSEIVKKRYQSKFANVIFGDLLCELGLRSGALNIALFVNGHSILTEGDKHKIDTIYPTYIADLSASDRVGGYEVKLYTYSISVIDNILDHVESTMHKGNIVKEALQCLRLDKESYLIMSSKEMGKEELESLALFAGAKKIIEPECLKDLEYPCIVIAGQQKYPSLSKKGGQIK